jgi:hypothetical protein
MSSFMSFIVSSMTKFAGTVCARADKLVNSK